ncbi:MAG: hypothetical protein NC181_04970 [Clostridium sp.]|nr:hypothetical protein [Clostridium sp.]MCM1444651.1 hypothetical protein [Candidatus Amulumruptor caecigallinarius]
MKDISKDITSTLRNFPNSKAINHILLSKEFKEKSIYKNNLLYYKIIPISHLEDFCKVLKR